MSIQVEVVENGLEVMIEEIGIDVALEQTNIELVDEDGCIFELTEGGVVYVAGRGMPSGGTTGQVLAKGSDTPFDTEWITPAPPEPFMRFQVNPDGGAAVFVADQASTVITATTIGSLNNGTSPTINLSFPANYESATAHPIASGSMGFHIPIDFAFQVVIFHDGQLSTHLLLAALINNTIPSGVKLSIQIAGFSGLNTVAIFENVGTSTPVQTNITPANSTATSFSILNHVLTIEGHTVAVDTSVYPYCTIIALQSIIAGSNAPVATYTFSNTLTLAGGIVPREAKDGDLLEIIGDGVMLGSPVTVGDKAFLCDNKTAISVFKKPVGTALSTFAVQIVTEGDQDFSLPTAVGAYADLYVNGIKQRRDAFSVMGTNLHLPAELIWIDAYVELVYMQTT